MTEYFLTIAPDDKQGIGLGKSGSGQGDLMRDLERTPLAVAERGPRSGKTNRYDTSYLCRFDDTDYCQWYGRISSGYFVPIGRVMQIVPAGAPQ